MQVNRGGDCGTTKITYSSENGGLRICVTLSFPLRYKEKLYLIVTRVNREKVCRGINGTSNS